jgi:hypothetical protein
MTRQQLGIAPSNGADAATKAYVDTLVASGVTYKTIQAGTANTWVRFGRATLGAVNDGVSVSYALLAAPDTENTVNVVEGKLRAGQRAAFGSNPAVDVVLTRATSVTTADIGYVIVQNTPSTIVDFYVRLKIVGRQYTLTGPISTAGTGAFTWISGEVGSTTTPSGLVAATTSMDIEYDAADLPPNAGVPVGWYIGPQGYGTGVATAASGVWCYNPIFIGYAGGTFDAFVSNLSTVRSGGTGTLTMFALHGDDGTGFPDTSVVLASATATVSTVGKVISTFAAPIALVPGIYWVASLYYAGSAAPTTQEQFTSISGGLMNVPLSPTITVGSTMRGLRSSAATYTGLPGTKLASSAIITQTGATSHYVMLRRSA